MGFYYVIFYPFNFTDPTYKYQYGSKRGGCYKSTSSTCAVTLLTINSVNSVMNYNMILMGLRIFNVPKTSNLSFALSTSSVTSSDWNFNIFYPGGSYSLTFEYLIYKHASCQGYLTDLYFTLDRSFCNNTCNATK
jgi:hypothetical protein